MKKYIIFNWKCNPETLVKAKQLFKSTTKVSFKDFEAVICPPFPYIGQLKAMGFKLKIGAQNCFYEPRVGPFTGEVSPMILKNMGCKYVILGHSERKRVFNETEETINKKLKAVLSVGVQPILFFGELVLMTKIGAEKEIIRQLEAILRGIDKKFLTRILFVYEPAFSVSTQGGKLLSSEEVEEKQIFIKKHLNNKFNFKPVVLYGGSVDGNNIKNYLKETNINGVVIGQASINLNKLERLVKVFIHG